MILQNTYLLGLSTIHHLKRQNLLDYRTQRLQEIEASFFCVQIHTTKVQQILFPKMHQKYFQCGRDRFSSFLIKKGQLQSFITTIFTFLFKKKTATIKLTNTNPTSNKLPQTYKRHHPGSCHQTLARQSRSLPLSYYIAF